MSPSLLRRNGHLSRRLTAGALIVAVVAGCAADDGDPTGTGDDREGGTLDPADHELHLPDATLVIDAELEGGCAWVTAAPDGAAYEVTWPDGYAVDFARLALVGPDGEIAAEDGDLIEVGGTPEPLAGTFCQVGTVLDADAVVTADG